MQNKIIYIILTIVFGFLSACRTSKESEVVPTNENKMIGSKQNPVQLIDSVHSVEDQNKYRVVEPKENSTEELYEKAYTELDLMLSGQTKLDFKRAVFVTEDAYFNDSLNYISYILTINNYRDVCLKLYEANTLKDYPYSDSLNFRKNFAIFTLLKDTTNINGENFLPLQYNFESNSNNAPWSSTFVSTLLDEGEGTCHSLPYLYKILANEMGAEAYLSLAPNHLYLKHRNKRLGWYNTEMTSGQFPTDAWVKASGYITIDAIRNGIYMDTLSQEQSIALCVYDLAMGYAKKTGNTLDGFIIKCCDLTLKYHPQNINAIILKAETLKKNYDFYVQQNDLKHANETFSLMRSLYVEGVQLGYREMPKEIYIAWLQSSIEGNEKYNNAAVSKTLNTTTK